MGKSGENRLLGRPRRRWEDNIKMDLQEVGWDWMEVAQGYGYVADTCGCGNEPPGLVKCGEFLE